MDLEYDDFTLEVYPDGNRAYQVSASSNGDQRSPMQVPTGLAHLAPSHSARTGSSRDVFRELLDNPPSSSPMDQARDLGRQLFQAALPSPILGLFRQRLAVARQSGKGLRLKVSIDTRDERLRWISDLPWELLYDPEADSFLALNTFTPIVRYRPVPSLVPPAPFSGSLHILALTANPIDHPTLDTESECKSLEAAVEKASAAKIRSERSATLERLVGLLQKQPFQVLHFMGHGTFKDGRGALLLENDYGEGAFLPDSTLCELVAAHPATQLVVLNACKTAQGARGSTDFPFTGLASRLLLKGVPAVIAMRLPITDSAALSFSSHFYENLVQRRPLECCLTQARLAIHCQEPESVEWAIPALYLNRSEGRLFQMKDELKRETTTTQKDESSIVIHQDVDSDSGLDVVGIDGDAGSPATSRIEIGGSVKAKKTIQIVGIRRVG